VTETVGNLENLNLEQLQKVYEMCKSFISFTDEVQKQVNAMVNKLKESLPGTVPYFKVPFDQQSIGNSRFIE
jgi:hypothetical protein